MKYRYDIQKGVVKYKTKTKRYVAGILASMAMVGGMAVPAIAAKPANPGCFGIDRAAHAIDNGSLGKEVGGVGYYASLRAGDNGAINQAYKTSCGGDPAP